MKTLWNPDTYNEALWFAARAHGSQTVPGSEISYILHLCQVCQEAMGAVVADPSLDGNLVMQCALLHDCIEDTDSTHSEVNARFGPSVADGVDALSKRESIDGKAVSKDEQMADSLARILQQPREVWIVKLADRITNLQTPPSHWNREKIERYHGEAIRILDALGLASPHLSERMANKLDAYRCHFQSGVA
jgi:(p)ppGpp synthase/HD superfamily hydrolase